MSATERVRSAPALKAGVASLCAAVLTLTAAVVVLAGRPQSAGAATRAYVMSSAAAYGKAHGYKVGIAVLDTKTGHLYSSGSHTSTFASESVVKVMIAARLILQGRMHGNTGLRAYKMITQSDDAIASSFYPSVGGDSLITWIKKHYHVPSLGSPPRRANWWGNTHITPDGLVRLYAKIKADKKVGKWLLHAMHGAKKHGSDGFYQYFGIPSATSHAAIKQGWGADYDDWSKSADENTTGFVNGDRYAVAILARGPISTYGSRIGAMLTKTAKLLLRYKTFPDGTPSIHTISSHSGRTAGGTHVTLRGTDFTHVTKVVFGGYRATRVKVLSASTISAYAPAHKPSTITIRVFTTHGNSSVHSWRYTYVGPPTLVSKSKSAGSTTGGTVITLSGTNLLHVSRVSFGSTAATSVKALSSRSLRVVAPKHAAGTVTITVTTQYGTSKAVAAGKYQFLDRSPLAKVAASTGSGSASGPGGRSTPGQSTGSTAPPSGTTAPPAGGSPDGSPQHP